MIFGKAVSITIETVLFVYKFSDFRYITLKKFHYISLKNIMKYNV